MNNEEFVLKNGGRVAMANEGEILVGANPFGICCPDCGTVQMMEWHIDKGYELDITLTRDDEETVRFREYSGIPGTEKDVARELLAMDDLVLQSLATVLPVEEKVEETPERRVAQLITILGMHREVLANYQATMRHMVKGIALARDAVKKELDQQKLLSVGSDNFMLIMALDALNTMVPAEEKEEESKIILVGGGRG